MIKFLIRSETQGDTTGDGVCMECFDKAEFMLLEQVLMILLHPRNPLATELDL